MSLRLAKRSIDSVGQHVPSLITTWMRIGPRKIVNKRIRTHKHTDTI